MAWLVVLNSVLSLVLQFCFCCFRRVSYGTTSDDTIIQNVVLCRLFRRAQLESDSGRTPKTVVMRELLECGQGVKRIRRFPIPRHRLKPKGSRSIGFL